jgi:hypothetical protein
MVKTEEHSVGLFSPQCGATQHFSTNQTGWNIGLIININLIGLTMLGCPTDAAVSLPRVTEHPRLANHDNRTTGLYDTLPIYSIFNYSNGACSEKKNVCPLFP